MATKGVSSARPCAKRWECPGPWRICPHHADDASPSTVCSSLP